MNELSTTHQNMLPSVGGFAFHSMREIEDFAILMSKASIAIPKHLRDNPGACMAIAIQASEWQMSPFSVANKSYSVNDRLAYEAQLVNAVILRRAPISGRFDISYKGDGATRQCVVSVQTTDGEKLEYVSPQIGQITVKNSPLWKADPDQQLFYFSSRSLCRRHFPDVILGIYTMDEMEESEPFERARNVTPKAELSNDVNPFDRAAIEEKPKVELSSLEKIAANLEIDKITVKDALGALATLGIGDGRTPFTKMDDATLDRIAADWQTVKEIIAQLESVKS